MKYEPLSFYAKCPSHVKPIWFMIVEENNFFYLKEEFEEEEHLHHQITLCKQGSPILEKFPTRADALKKALSVIKIIRPEAITKDLEDEIELLDS